MSSISIRLFLPVVLLTVAGLPLATAQRSEKYSLQVEVLIQPIPSDRLRTQEWGNVFFNLGRRATFRQGRNREKTRIEDTSSETRKSVRVVGIMNRDGSISFHGQKFTLKAPKPLAQWLTKLEEFGPKGPPNESSTWGLSDEQFTAVLKLLGEPVTAPVKLHSAPESLESLQLSPLFRVTFTESARKRAVPSGNRQDTTTDYAGLTKGSVLAALLARSGLGFRPKADDRGNFIIEVDAGNEADNMYPVGWKNTAPITLVVPELSKSIPVTLEDAPLASLITVIAQNLKRPHFYSTFELGVAGLDAQKIKYSRKPDKITLFNLMNIIGKTHHLGLSLRTDEAGSVFLWVTTEAEAKAFRDRFAHVKLKI